MVSVTMRFGVVAAGVPFGVAVGGDAGGKHEVMMPQAKS